MLDDIDRRLLRHFQRAPGLGASELSDRAGVPPATCARRLERMQAEGVIRGNHAVIDWRALGYEVEVSLLRRFVPEPHSIYVAFPFSLRNGGILYEAQGGLVRPGGWLAVMTCFQTDDARFADWHYRRDPTHVVFYRDVTLRHIAQRRGFDCEIPVKDVALMRKRRTADTAA